jgi:cell wall-associated NlpC family hydrolase
VATESALQDFEVKNKLDVDGAFSVADRDLLYSPSARPKIDPTPTPAPTPKRTPAPTPKPSKTNSGSGASAGSTPGAGAPPGGSGSTKTDPPVTDPPDSGASSGGSYSASYSAEGIISVANAMKGVRYSWSEESPEKGFDCSGLVYYCLRTCGVSTSRYSAAGFSQVSSWSHIDSISGLSRGDLVFFRNDTSSKVSHTGIYLGGGSFIHASASSGKVIVSSIDTSYWTRNFVCGRRIF